MSWVDRLQREISAAAPVLLGILIGLVMLLAFLHSGCAPVSQKTNAIEPAIRKIEGTYGEVQGACCVADSCYLSDEWRCRGEWQGPMTWCDECYGKVEPAYLDEWRFQWAVGREAFERLRVRLRRGIIR